MKYEVIDCLYKADPDGKFNKWDREENDLAEVKRQTKERKLKRPVFVERLDMGHVPDAGGTWKTRFFFYYDLEMTEKIHSFYDEIQKEREGILTDAEKDSKR